MKTKQHTSLHTLVLALSLLLAAWTQAWAAYTPVAGTVITISTADGLSLGVKGNATTSNTNVEFQTTDATNTFQQWLVSAIDGVSDAYVLVNMGSGYALDFTAENTESSRHVLQYDIEMNNASQQIVFNADGTISHKGKTKNGKTYQWYLSATASSLRVQTQADATVFTVNSQGTTTVSMVYITAPDGTVLGIDSGAPNENAGKYTFPKDYQTSWQAKSLTNKQQWWKKENHGTYFTLVSMYDESQALDFALDSNGNKKKPSMWDNANASNTNQQLYADADGHIYAKSGDTPWYLTTSTTNLKTKDATQAAKVTFQEETTEVATDAYPDAPFRQTWVEDQTKVADNKLDARATFMPYPTTAAMRADTVRYNYPWVDPANDADYISLNGTWKFKFTANWKKDEVPGCDDFYGSDADVSAWDDITVPLNWEMAGYDIPVYCNIGYLFADNPPYVGDPTSSAYAANPVGSYRRTFTLPDSWVDAKRRVLLHFDGACSAIAVWVNGHYTGYSQGSNTDAEFDITKYAKAGENSVAVRCYRWSDGSYLEGQDMWRLGGIHRDVYLLNTPSTFITDHFIYATDMDAAATKATLNVDLKVFNYVWENKANQQIKVTLRDASGATVAEQTSAFATNGGKTSAQGTISLTGLTGLKAWSTESPYLYTVEVSQLNGTDEEMAFSTKFGFRNVQVKDNKYITINDQRMFFKGVNTQDIQPDKGHAIDVPTMLKDIVMMKQNNVNTLRASHYPRQAKMYAMMDYYGLYCMDEADIECHKNWNDHQLNGTSIISDNSAWQTAFVDRTERMVLRDRNHPCVVFWSLGNESGGGQNFQACYDRVKALLPLRDNVVHYEGEKSGNTTYSDLSSNMYPTVRTVVDAKMNGLNSVKKPYFLCEYAHAMGQGVGNLQEYWNAIETSDYVIGGCIWDWVDQALYSASDLKSGTLVQEGTGFHYLKSGSDFGKLSNSYNGFNADFMDNGIVTAGREQTAKLAEVKYAYRPVDFSAFDKSTKKLTLKNKLNFTNLSSLFTLRYNVLCDGYVVEEGTATVPSTLPGAEKNTTVRYQTTVNNNHEYVLTLMLCLKSEQTWAPKGHCLLTSQFRLNDGADVSHPFFFQKDAPVKLATINATQGQALAVSGNTVSGTDAQGKAFSLTFADNGTLATWTYDGTELVEGGKGPDYCSFRKIANNTQVAWQNKFDSYFRPDLTATSRALAQAPALQDDGTVTAKATTAGRNGSHTYIYTIYTDGTVDLKAELKNTWGPAEGTSTSDNNNYSVSSNDGFSLRTGFTMQFAKGFEQVQYYAKGPWSNYIDRQRSQLLGRYNTTVTDMTEELSALQTMADHMALRQLTLNNGSVALDIQAQGPVSFSLTHYDDSQFNYDILYAPRHLYDGKWNSNVTPKEAVIAHFDAWQSGLGNDSCNGDIVMQKYACPQGTFSFTLRFKPTAQ